MKEVFIMTENNEITNVAEDSNASEIEIFEVKKNKVDIYALIKKTIHEFNPNFNDEDVDQIIDIMKRVDRTKDLSIFLYNNLPSKVRDIIDNNIYGAKKSNTIIEKEKMAKKFIETIGSAIQLAIMSETLQNKTEEMKETPPDTDVKVEGEDNIEKKKIEYFNNLVSIRNIDDKFFNDNIPNEEYKVEIFNIFKEGFESAESLDFVLEYLNNDSVRNVKRYYQHFNSAPGDFAKYIMDNHKYVFPYSIDHMFGYLHDHLKNYNKYKAKEIKSFIVLLVRSFLTLDPKEMKDYTYIHRVIMNIYGLDTEPAAKHTDYLWKVMDIIDRIKEILILDKIKEVIYKGSI